jgi:hypothetical protein
VRKIPALITFTLLALIAVPAFAGNGRQVASGSGHIIWNEELRTFNFHARVDEDGVVRGRGLIQNRANDNKVKFLIDCLSVTDNVATMSGVVTATDAPDFADNPVWFRVIDHGDGSQSADDEMTLVGIFTGGVGVDCSGEVLLDLLPVERGNIQVRGERLD